MFTGIENQLAHERHTAYLRDADTARQMNLHPKAAAALAGRRRGLVSRIVEHVRALFAPAHRLARHGY